MQPQAFSSQDELYLKHELGHLIKVQSSSQKGGFFFMFFITFAEIEEVLNQKKTEAVLPNNYTLSISIKKRNWGFLFEGILRFNECFVSIDKKQESSILKKISIKNSSEVNVRIDIKESIIRVNLHGVKSKVEILSKFYQIFNFLYSNQSQKINQILETFVQDYGNEEENNEDKFLPSWKNYLNIDKKMSNANLKNLRSIQDTKEKEKATKYIKHYPPYSAMNFQEVKIDKSLNQICGKSKKEIEIQLLPSIHSPNNQLFQNQKKKEEEKVKIFMKLKLESMEDIKEVIRFLSKKMGKMFDSQKKIYILESQFQQITELTTISAYQVIELFRQKEQKLRFFFRCFSNEEDEEKRLKQWRICLEFKKQKHSANFQSCTPQEKQILKIVHMKSETQFLVNTFRPITVKMNQNHREKGIFEKGLFYERVQKDIKVEAAPRLYREIEFYEKIVKDIYVKRINPGYLTEKPLQDHEPQQQIQPQVVTKLRKYSTYEFLNQKILNKEDSSRAKYFFRYLILILRQALLAISQISEVFHTNSRDVKLSNILTDAARDKEYFNCYLTDFQNFCSLDENRNQSRITGCGNHQCGQRSCQERQKIKLRQEHLDTCEGIIDQTCGIKEELNLEEEHIYFRQRNYDILTLLKDIEDFIEAKLDEKKVIQKVQDYYAYRVLKAILHNKIPLFDKQLFDQDEFRNQLSVSRLQKVVDEVYLFYCEEQ